MATRRGRANGLAGGGSGGEDGGELLKSLRSGVAESEKRGSGGRMKEGVGEVFRGQGGTVGRGGARNRAVEREELDREVVSLRLRAHNEHVKTDNDSKTLAA